MKIIRIIIATTADELKSERKELGDYIRTLNDHYHNKGIYFRLENLLDIETEEEKNQELCDSEFFYIIFSDEADSNIVNKFDMALQHFKEKDSPRIYTYFQKLPDSVNASASVKGFMERLDKEIGHYYSMFLHLDSIKLNMLLELTRSQVLQGTIDIKNGIALVDGKEILSLENVPIFRDNQEFHNLIKEREELQEKRVLLAKKYAANPNDVEIDQQLTSTGVRLKEITSQLHQIEKEVLSICTTVAELNGTGKLLSWREIAACRCFEEGNYKGALAIVRDPNLEIELDQAKELSDLTQKRFSEYIRVKRLNIKGLKALGVNAKTLPEITDCYEKAVSVAEKYLVDIIIVFEYANFLFQQKDYKKSLEKALWFMQQYSNYQDIANIYLTIEIYSFLGKLFKNLMQYDLAEDSYIRAVRLQEDLIKENPVLYGNSLAVDYTNLGLLLMDTNHFSDAEVVLQKAISIQEELALGNPSLYENSLIVIYDSLGLLYSQTKRLQEAFDIYKKSLFICKKAAEKEFLLYGESLASIHNDLANLLVDMLKYQEAEEEYKNAIEILEKLTKSMPSSCEDNLATYYNNLGNLFIIKQSVKEAEVYIKKAINIQKQLVKYNPFIYGKDLASSYNTLANFMVATNKDQEAIKFYKTAIRIIEDLGSDNNQTAYERELAEYYHNLGVSLFAMKNYQEAEMVLRKAGSIWENSKQKNLIITNVDDNLANNYEVLSRLFLKIDKFKEAECLAEKATIIRKEILRYDNSLGNKENLAKSSNFYCSTLVATCRYPEAIELYRKVIDEEEQLVKEKPAECDISVLADSYQGLGLTLYCTKDYEKTKILCLKALTIWKQLDRQENIKITKGILAMLPKEENLFIKILKSLLAQCW